MVDVGFRLALPLRRLKKEPPEPPELMVIKVCSLVQWTERKGTV